MINTRPDAVSRDKRPLVDDAATGNNDEQSVTTASDDTPFSVTLGRQLREAREACRMDLETCAHELRLPARVLRKLEAGDYAGIDSVVYLRDYLTSYAVCVGLPKHFIAEAIGRLAPVEKTPQLVATGGVPHSYYLFQRYTSAITYIVLTAVIVLPLVWLGFQGGLNRELAHVEPLEPTPQSGTAQNQAPDAVAIQTQKTQHETSEKPLMASMAPFAVMDRIDKRNKPARLSVAPVAAGHTLKLSLTQPSWVDITDSEGNRLQYRLLPAGTHKTYHSTRALEVSIGDVSGATVSLDGKSVNLGDYQRANVANFQVALKDGKASIQPN